MTTGCIGEVSVSLQSVAKNRGARCKRAPQRMMQQSLNTTAHLVAEFARIPIGGVGILANSATTRCAGELIQQQELRCRHHAERDAYDLLRRTVIVLAWYGEKVTGAPKSKLHFQQPQQKRRLGRGEMNRTSLLRALSLLGKIMHASREARL